MPRREDAKTEDAPTISVCLAKRRSETRHGASTEIRRRGNFSRRQLYQCDDNATTRCIIGNHGKGISKDGTRAIRVIVLAASASANVPVSRMFGGDTIEQR